MTVLSVDNIDQKNNKELIISGKRNHGLYITAIQAVICNVGSQVPREVRLTMSLNRRYESINDEQEFVDVFILSKDVVDITTYKAIFIGLFIGFKID